MFNNSFYQNPYAQRLAQMEQQIPQPQPIHTIQQVNPQAICYFVNSKNDLQNIQVNPNVVYVGINKQTKEVYLRSWNNDGMIDFDTYSLAEGKQESSELKTIMDKLENKLKEIDNERYATANNPKHNDRSDAKQSYDGIIQPNDARKVKRTAD
mgnify:CR=1 FL=1|nr:MAG TPA: hypothetical protein [Caudoviricetes sp.]